MGGLSLYQGMSLNISNTADDLSINMVKYNISVLISFLTHNTHIHIHIINYALHYVFPDLWKMSLEKK